MAYLAFNITSCSMCVRATTVCRHSPHNDIVPCHSSSVHQYIDMTLSSPTPRLWRIRREEGGSHWWRTVPFTSVYVELSVIEVPTKHPYIDDGQGALRQAFNEWPRVHKSWTWCMLSLHDGQCLSQMAKPTVAWFACIFVLGTNTVCRKRTYVQHVCVYWTFHSQSALFQLIPCWAPYCMHPSYTYVYCIHSE